MEGALTWRQWARDFVLPRCVTLPVEISKRDPRNKSKNSADLEIMHKGISKYGGKCKPESFTHALTSVTLRVR